MSNIFEAIKKNPRLPALFALHRLSPWISDDEFFIKKEWKYNSMGYKLDLNAPKSFNEKIQWLKLYNRNPIYTTMVDKVKAKDYVANIIGEKYIIPTLAVWENPDDIDFDNLPDKFVLKCNHNSVKGLYICKDKNEIDKRNVISNLKKGLKQNWFYYSREWPYYNVKPLVLAEKYMVDESDYELKDYKIFNFNGEPKIIQIDYDRYRNHKRNIYDIDWNLLDYTFEYPSDGNRIFEKPVVLDELLSLARKLSKGLPFLRTDFYIIGEKIFFGELTFFPEGGYGHAKPIEFDFKMGSWLTLPDML